MFQKISIIGLGLLGGSICRALRRRESGADITVYARSPEKLEKAVRDGTADRVLPVDEIAPAGADLVIICAPVIPSVDIVVSLLSMSALESQTLIIDVGSVKRPVVDVARDHERGGRFIGCHPMTGSEKTGYEYSSEDLYRGASVIITPHEHNDPEDIEKVERFWRDLGAKTVITTAEKHDSFVARTSHLPHLLACLLVGLADGAEEGIEDPRPFIGNGFRDMTRIAGGSPEMWADIFTANGDNMEKALALLGSGIAKFTGKLKSESGHGQVKTWLQEIRAEKGKTG